MQPAKCFTRPTRSVSAAQAHFDKLSKTHETHPYAVIIIAPHRMVICDFVAYTSEGAKQALSEWREVYPGAPCSVVRMGSEVHLQARIAVRCGAASIADFYYRTEMEALEQSELPVY